MKKKVTGVILAVSIFAGSLTGCSLFTSKDKEEIGEKADTFVSEMLKGRYERAARAILDEDDDFMKKLPEDNKQLTIMEEVMYNSTYEIGEIEVHKFDKEATALVKLSYSDVEAITADGDLPLGEVMTALAENSDMTEAEISVDFVYDDDEWFVDPDSAITFIEYFSDMCEDLPLGGINEDSAVEYAQQFIGMMAEGSFTESLAMADLTTADVISALYLDYYYTDDEVDISDSLDEMMGMYYSTYDPTYTAQYVDDNTYGVSISGNAVDDVAALTDLVQDQERFVPLLAEILAPFAAIYDSYDWDIDMDAFFSAYSDLYLEALSDTTYTADKSFYIEVSCDDYGNYSIAVDDSEDLFPTGLTELFGIIEASDEETMLAALELLHDDGRMSDAAYYSIAPEYWETELPEGYELVAPDRYEDEIYEEYAFFTDSMVCFCLETWDYSDAGDIYRYDLKLDGEFLVEGGTYESPTDYSDIIFVSYDFGDEIPEGTISLIVYTVGIDSQTILDELYIVPEGSTVDVDDQGDGGSGGLIRGG